MLATVLFAVLGAALLLIANRVAAASQRELLGEVTGSMIGTLLDWTLAIILFFAAGIMMAGSGAVFAEHWHLNRGLGTVLMAVHGPARRGNRHLRCGAGPDRDGAADRHCHRGEAGQRAGRPGLLGAGWAA